MSRKEIQVAIKRALLEETIYRCANCLVSIEYCEGDNTFFRFDEKAHITPYNETQDNSFENLITLCPNCHTKFDKNKDKKGSLKRLKELKLQWLGISGKYSKLELDCLLALYRYTKEDNKIYFIYNQEFTKKDGTKVTYPVFSVPVKQMYLFYNLIINKLVHVQKMHGAVKSNGVVLISGHGPYEDELLLFLSTNGKTFCEKISTSINNESD